MVEKMIEAAERNATQVEGFDLTVLYPPSIRHILAYSGATYWTAVNVVLDLQSLLIPEMKCGFKWRGNLF